MKFELLNPFSYAKDGETVTASYLDITAPNNAVMYEVGYIDKMFIKAMNNFADKSVDENKKDSDEEIEPKQFYFALAMADANMEKCLDMLRKILIRTCMIDGEAKFTSPLFDKMDFDDTKRLLGWYIKNFLFTSLAN